MPEEARICLVNPMRIPTYPPLNLTYLASYLRKYGRHRYAIKLVDINCSDDPVRETLEFRPDIIGMTTLSSHLVEICGIANKIRSINKDTLLVCGGAHATITPNDLLNHGGFDVAVMGEGEVSFRELTDIYLGNNKRFNADLFKDIKGIAFKSDGRTVINERREIINELDTIPHPERSLLNNTFYNNRYYVLRSKGTSGVTTIAGSRGCPYDCIFCGVNLTANRKVRMHSIGYIIEEMEAALKHKAKWLFFTDDIFLINKKIVSDLCAEVIKRGLNKKLKWECQVRSNLVSWDTLPLLKLMKKAGCEQIGYGFESANPRVLTLIKGKGITVGDHQRAIDVTNKAGIKVFGSFILGTPTETYKELMDTRDFIIKNYDNFHRFQMTFMVPYPATRVYDLCVERGFLSKDYFAELEADKEGNLREGFRIFSDTIPHQTLRDTKRELENLSLKKVALIEKLNWLIFNLFHNRDVFKIGVRWVKERSKGGKQ